MALRGQQIRGLQFRRQDPVGPFILDFYCPKRKLGIELDGSVHDGQEVRDQARTEALATLKIRVIRFRNEEVFGSLSSVIHRIEAALDERECTLPLSRRSLPGEGAGGRGLPRDAPLP